MEIVPLEMPKIIALALQEDMQGNSRKVDFSKTMNIKELFIDGRRGKILLYVSKILLVGKEGGEPLPGRPELYTSGIYTRVPPREAADNMVRKSKSEPFKLKGHMC